MFTVPASKVSAPFVVIRTAVSTAASAIEPPVTITNVPVSADPALPDADQVLPVTFVIVILPPINAAADALFNPKPVVNEAAPRVDAPNLTPPPAYPVIVYVGVAPVPNCTRILDVLLKLTPLNVTVIFFTHAGKLVKSIAAPDVDATAVPEVMPRITPELIVTLADPSITVLMPMSPR